MKWYIEAFQSSGKFSLNLIARSAATVLRGIGKITGGGFLEAMAEFLAELNDLFGGFKERAERVRKELRGSDVSFLLVTSPSPLAIQEARYFYERLVEHQMPRGGFIVNRFHLPPEPSSASAEDVGAALGAGAELGERAQEAYADAAMLAALDAANVQALEPARLAGTPVLRVAAMPQDVHDLRMLASVATSIMSGGV
jgi:anion-transporting  ArsA/GET3 family ATPase